MAPSPGRAADVIDTLVHSVASDSIDANVIELEAFVTRSAQTPNCFQAGRWLERRFQSFGVDSIFVQQWTVAYAPNVVAVIQGRRRPHRVVLIGGHYDSRSSSFSAPGADDNASGTSCVLECARVLAGQQFDCTVEFAAFSAEEIGLVGSNAYAAHFNATADTLIAMINVDMIGYLAPQDRRDLDLIGSGANGGLRDLAASTTARYVPSLPTVPGAYPANATSDVASFWNRGYPAIAFFEDSDASSPFLHTPDDTYLTSYNDPELALLCTRAAVALLATLAQPLGVPVVVEDLLAARAGEAVQLSWRLADEAHVRLQAIAVQRAPDASGPWAVMSATGLVPARDMQWTDMHPPGGTLWYRLSLVDDRGVAGWSAPVAVGAGAGATTYLLAPVDHGAAGVAIHYVLAPQSAPASLALFDVTGRRIRVLDADQRTPGTHVRTWDRLDDQGRTAARGVYFVQLATPASTVARKITVTRGGPR